MRETVQKLPFDELAGILRTSTKYEILPYRWKCIQELKDSFPVTLVAFEAGGSHRPPNQLLISAITLFRQCNALELLPVAYYHLTYGSLDDSLDRIVGLSQDEMLRCIRGRNKLLQAQEAHTAAHFYRYKPSDVCAHRDLCNAENARYLRHNLSNSIHMKQWALVGRMTLTSDNPNVCLKYCSNCLVKYRSLHLLGRVRVWNELPGYFGLGTWEELRAAS